MSVLTQRPPGTRTSTVSIRLSDGTRIRVEDFARKELLGLGLAYERLLCRALVEAENEVDGNAEKP